MDIWVYTYLGDLNMVEWPYPIEELVEQYPHAIYFYATLAVPD